ncbi:hypothetical protein BOTBODRAFT_224408 [Botryobasidium botryosum FD-172 SS1]|uniref:Uncharacterized protein n=1 Tax=Botryobasidium botryosum (strain FD-172 SS1) TaxID=930990 RepID=A0A067MND6_BOTB1|nr:hypothetical protein BOTBODRAFT_224408 [Botryobasidium botryosum FD-172 SS1]
MPDLERICNVELARGQVIGLAFAVQASFVSLLAIIAFFALVIRNSVLLRRHPFQSHIDIYVTSLLLSDAFHSIMAITYIPWLKDQAVKCGALCTTQGVLIQLGPPGAAISTLAIAIHTFCIIVFRWSPPKSKIVPLVVVSLIWLFNILFALIGYAVHGGLHGDPPFYTPSPFWCWVHPFNTTIRIFSEYLWLDIAVFTSIALYIPMYFSMKGIIRVESDAWHMVPIVRVRSRHGMIRPPPVIDDIAKKMLWYPLAYAIMVLPFEINRWAYLQKIHPGTAPKDVPFASTGVVLFIFQLAGVVNVLLLTLTRPNLLLLGRGRNSGGGGRRGPLRDTQVAELSFGQGPNGTIIGADRYVRNPVGDDKDEVPGVPPIPIGLRTMEH